MFAPYQAIKLGMTQFEAVMARAGPGTPVAPRIANPIAAPMVPTNMAKAVQPPSPEPQEPKAPKQPHYDGEKLILADARASWLRSPNPSGFEAIEPLISSDETKSKIFKLIGSVNRSLSRKQQGWLRASDAGLFLQRAREVEQFDFWPEERGEITIVLDESTKRPRRGGWDRKTRKSSRAVVGEDEEEYVDD